MVTSLSELRRTQPSSLGSKKVEVTGIVISTDEKGFTVQTPDSAAERAGIFVYAEQGYSVKPGDAASRRPWRCEGPFRKQSAPKRH
jgi:hypothetical protein